MKKLIEKNADIIKLLNGELFDSGVNFDISNFSNKEIFSRIESLLQITKNSNVIHIGCGDHLDLIDEKINNQTHLHSLLIENAKKCIGFDIEDSSINHLKSQHNINNVYSADVTDKEFKFSKFSNDKDWDFIVLGEIIEHIDNPVQFLSSIKENFSSCAKEILVTAPNAYSWSHVLSYSQNQIELINSDHRFWFTPYTILKILVKSNIQINDLYFADPVVNRKKSILNKILKLFKSSNQMYLPSHLSSTLIVRGSI